MSITDFDPTRFKLGTLCKHGHDWNGTGKSLRCVKPRHDCVECKRINSARYRHSEKGKDNSAIYYNANKEKIVKKAIDWNKANPEKARQKYKDYYYSEYGGLQERIRKHRRRVSKLKDGHTVEFNHEELRKVFTYFSCECAYCGSKNNITIDHYIALDKGGSHSVDNIVLACSFCNTSKKNRDVVTWYFKRKYFCQNRWNKIQAYINKKQEFIQLNLFT